MTQNSLRKCLIPISNVMMGNCITTNFLFILEKSDGMFLSLRIICGYDFS
jgi:hypothetical protein